MRFSILKKCIWRIKNYIHNYDKKWDELAPDVNSMDQFVAEILNSEPLTFLPGNSNEFTVEYQLAHYCAEYINPILRRCEEHPDIEKFLAAFAEKEIKKDIVLYRGICQEVLIANMRAAEGIEGVDLYDKAFLNTSLIKGAELNYKTKIRIFVPKGTRAIFVGGVNNENYFYEVIVTKGAKLKILSKDKHYYNCILITTD
ncbi:TPA: ADP-ribosyltransferase [Streptococcus suis]